MDYVYQKLEAISVNMDNMKHKNSSHEVTLSSITNTGPVSEHEKNFLLSRLPLPYKQSIALPPESTIA